MYGDEFDGGGQMPRTDGETSIGSSTSVARPQLAARDWRRWFALWDRLLPHLPRDRYPGKALELALGTLGRNASVLAVGTETHLAPDAAWFEITPAPGWLPRLMSTEPRHVLLLSADGTRTLLIRTAYQRTHETFAYATAELLGR